MQRQRFPREFLIYELKRVARLLGRPPFRKEFRNNSRVSPETLVKRFGSWSAALANAGFEPSKLRQKHENAELIAELRKIAKRLGRTPTSTEFEANSTFGAATVARRLGGGWLAACKRANLEPPEHKPRTNVRGGWNKGQRKLQVPEDELRYLYETEGLSAPSIGRKLNVSRQTVLRMLREYNIPVKRLHYTQPRETQIETLLYQELENRQVPFVRQPVIDGFYVVDALVPGARIVIECDGEYWHSIPGAAERDERRQRHLEGRGYRVFRFPEAAIIADVKACVERVVDALVNTYAKSRRKPDA